MIFCQLWAYFAGVATGVNYIYQSVIGSFTGFCYLVITLAFDKEIHRFSEKCGFLLSSSKQAKFSLFFLCLSFFVVNSMLALSTSLQWKMPLNWLANAIQTEPECRDKFPLNASFTMGLDSSYYLTS